MKWEYIQPVTIRFGEGIVKEVKDVAASMGCKSVDLEAQLQSFW